MAAPFMPGFHSYPKEAAIIGRLLAGYGELEFLLCRCVAGVNGDLSTAARIMFRGRGEELRINVADAVVTPEYAKNGLLEVWKTARRGMSWCKGTRNLFSHCHWLNDPNGLFYTNLEKGAKSATGKIALEFFHVDFPLLEKHEQYFQWTGMAFCFLEAQHALLSGRSKTNPWKTPEEMKQPPRYNPPELHKIESQAEFRARRP